MCKGNKNNQERGFWGSKEAGSKERVSKGLPQLSRELVPDSRNHAVIHSTDGSLLNGII